MITKEKIEKLREIQERDELANVAKSERYLRLGVAVLLQVTITATKGVGTVQEVIKMAKELVEGTR